MFNITWTELTCTELLSPIFSPLTRRQLCSDWEYPGQAGAAGNTFSPSDSANFLSFLQLLRSLLPPDARITAATQVWPFVDANGAHMKDISAFAQVLNWVLLMNYDVWSCESSSPAFTNGSNCG